MSGNAWLKSRFPTTYFTFCSRILQVAGKKPSEFLLVHGRAGKGRTAANLAWSASQISLPSPHFIVPRKWKCSWRSFKSAASIRDSCNCSPRVQCFHQIHHLPSIRSDEVTDSIIFIPLRNSYPVQQVRTQISVQLIGVDWCLYYSLRTLADNLDFGPPAVLHPPVFGQTGQRGQDHPTCRTKEPENTYLRRYDTPARAGTVGCIKSELPTLIAEALIPNLDIVLITL